MRKDAAKYVGACAFDLLLMPLDGRLARAPPRLYQ
jgi:hypothetical protein